MLMLLTALLAAPVQDTPDLAVLDGRGWGIRCAVTAHYAKEQAGYRLDTAREAENARGVAAIQADIARFDAIYRDALAAPFDVPTGPERFALAHEYRDWATGLEDIRLDDVLAACEVALATPTQTAD
jgi:hypothetical protein